MSKKLYMQKNPTWRQPTAGELAREAELMDAAIDAQKQRQRDQPQAAVDEAEARAKPPRINQYTCTSCSGVITTIDRDHGVTPFMLACRATEGCHGTMHSHLYRVAPGLTPDHEWYKPTSLKGLTAGMRDHVEMGGLLIRKIESDGQS